MFCHGFLQINHRATTKKLAKSTKPRLVNGLFDRRRLLDGSVPPSRRCGCMEKRDPGRQFSVQLSSNTFLRRNDRLLLFIARTSISISRANGMSTICCVPRLLNSVDRSASYLFGYVNSTKNADTGNNHSPPVLSKYCYC